MDKLHVNFHLSDTTRDRDAHIQSARIDVAQDRRAFLAMPEIKNFVRMASHLERLAYGLGDSPTAITEVSLVEVNGRLGIHRLSWDPAKRKRPKTSI